MGASSLNSSFHVHATVITQFQIDALAGQKTRIPGMDASMYVLLDDDQKVCRPVTEGELSLMYVDRNISSYRLDGIESWPEVPNPDNHNVILTYNDGRSLTLALGSISLDNGPIPDDYFKIRGIAYAVQSSGAALLDSTNTPNLSYIRSQYWDMARRQVETNLMMAEITASFASAVSGLAHAADAANYVTAEDFDGNVPTPAEDLKDEVDSQGSGQGSGSSGDSN